MSEQAIEKQVEDKGPEAYEAAEPKTALIAVFGIATIVILAVVVFAIQAYYDRVSEQQLFVKVLEPVSEDLRNLRAREDRELHSYQFLDRKAGTVRIPIERAMELLIKEAAEGRLPYPAKPRPVLTPQQMAVQPPVPAGGGVAPAK